MQLPPKTSLLLVLVLAACYPDPTFPSSEAIAPQDSASASSSATGAPKPDLDSTAQAARRQQVVTQTVRLGAGHPEAAREKRAGAGDWRPVELEKLREIVSDCCRTSEVACRDCLEALCEARMPPDELWSIYGAFLGPLRNRATAGVEVLGRHLLLHPEGRIRDRAFRVAVGSEVSVRGEPSAEGYRAALLPRRPQLGEPALLIVEHAALCTEVTGELKGPDASGRIDLKLRPDCPNAELPPMDGIVPAAIRYVYTHELDALPMGGIELWVADEEAPLLTLGPAPKGQR